MVPQSPRVKLALWQKKQGHANLLAAGSKLPILVIYGTEDKHINGRKIEEITKWSFGFGRIEFHALEGSGHMPFYGRPEATNNLIQDWVNRVN